MTSTHSNASTRNSTPTSEPKLSTTTNKQGILSNPKLPLKSTQTSLKHTHKTTTISKSASNLNHHEFSVNERRQLLQNQSRRLSKSSHWMSVTSETIKRNDPNVTNDSNRGKKRSLVASPVSSLYNVIDCTEINKASETLSEGHQNSDIEAQHNEIFEVNTDDVTTEETRRLDVMNQNESDDLKQQGIDRGIYYDMCDIIMVIINNFSLNEHDEIKVHVLPPVETNTTVTNDMNSLLDDTPLEVMENSLKDDSIMPNLDNSTSNLLDGHEARVLDEPDITVLEERSKTMLKQNNIQNDTIKTSLTTLTPNHSSNLKLEVDECQNSDPMNTPSFGSTESIEIYPRITYQDAVKASQSMEASRSMELINQKTISKTILHVKESNSLSNLDASHNYIQLPEITGILPSSQLSNKTNLNSFQSNTSIPNLPNIETQITTFKQSTVKQTPVHNLTRLPQLHQEMVKVNNNTQKHSIIPPLPLPPTHHMTSYEISEWYHQIYQYQQSQPLKGAHHKHRLESLGVLLPAIKPKKETKSRMGKKRVVPPPFSHTGHQGFGESSKNYGGGGGGSGIGIGGGRRVPVSKNFGFRVANRDGKIGVEFGPLVALGWLKRNT